MTAGSSNFFEDKEFFNKRDKEIKKRLKKVNEELGITQSNFNKKLENFTPNKGSKFQKRLDSALEASYRAKMKQGKKNQVKTRGFRGFIDDPNAKPEQYNKKALDAQACAQNQGQGTYNVIAGDTIDCIAGYNSCASGVGYGLPQGNFDHCPTERQPPFGGSFGDSCKNQPKKELLTLHNASKSNREFVEKLEKIEMKIYPLKEKANYIFYTKIVDDYVLFEFYEPIPTSSEQLEFMDELNNTYDYDIVQRVQKKLYRNFFESVKEKFGVNIGMIFKDESCIKSFKIKISDLMGEDGKKIEETKD